MPKRNHHGLYPREFPRNDDASVLAKAIDFMGSAGDVYADFQPVRYPDSQSFLDWERVGGHLYQAMGMLDEEPSGGGDDEQPE